MPQWRQTLYIRISVEWEMQAESAHHVFCFILHAYASLSLLLFTPPWLSSNMLFLSHLLFPIFTVKLPWECLLQCTLNMHCTAIQLSLVSVCDLRAAAENMGAWTSYNENWPTTLSFNGWRRKKDFNVEKVHVSRITASRFILVSTGDSLFFRVSLGFVFLFDQSAGSHIICRTSVAGNSNGEGVVLTWQRVNSTHL